MLGPKLRAPDSYVGTKTTGSVIICWDQNYGLRNYMLGTKLRAQELYVGNKTTGSAKKSLGPKLRAPELYILTKTTGSGIIGWDQNYGLSNKMLELKLWAQDLMHIRCAHQVSMLNANSALRMYSCSL